MTEDPKFGPVAEKYFHLILRIQVKLFTCDKGPKFGPLFIPVYRYLLPFLEYRRNHDFPIILQSKNVNFRGAKLPVR